MSKTMLCFTPPRYLLMLSLLIILAGCASGSKHQYSTYRIPNHSPKGYVKFYNFYTDHKKSAKGFNINVWSGWSRDGVQTKRDNSIMLGEVCDIGFSPFLPGSRFVSCTITVPPGMHTFYVGHGSGAIHVGRAKAFTLMAKENMIKLVRAEFHGSMGVPRRGYGYIETPYSYSLEVVEGGWIPVGSDANAVNLLLEAMKHSDWGTRWHAADRFGDINVRDRTAIQALKEASENDPDPDVKDIASKVLKKQRIQETLKSVKAPQTIEPQADTSKDRDKDGRNRVPSALDETKAPQTVDPLIAALKDQNPDIRKQAARRMGEIKETKFAEPLIIIALKDHDPEVRAWAIWGLGKIKDPRAVEHLITSMKDKDSEIRCNSARALGELKDIRATEALVASLKDEDLMVRREVIRALTIIKDPRAVEPLFATLKDQNSSVREWAIEALGELRDPRAKEPLTIASKDQESVVRIKATDALRKIMQVSEIEPSKTLLKDQDPSLRRRAVIELGMIGKPAVEVLIDTLGDKDPLVRCQAAIALGQIGDPRGVDPLIGALKDPDSRVLWGATLGLKRIILSKVAHIKWISLNKELEGLDESYDRWREWWGKNKHSFLVDR